MPLYGEVLIRATKIQIEEFKQSLIWKDIKRELGVWERMAKDELVILANDCVDNAEGSTSALAKLGSIQGRIQTIRYLLGIPDNFISILEEQANARRNETD